MIGIIPFPDYNIHVVHSLKNALSHVGLEWKHIDVHQYMNYDPDDYEHVIYVGCDSDYFTADGFAHKLLVDVEKWHPESADDFDFDGVTLRFDGPCSWALDYISTDEGRAPNPLPIIRGVYMIDTIEDSGENRMCLRDPVSILQLGGSPAEIHRDVSALTPAALDDSISISHFLLLRRRHG